MPDSTPLISATPDDLAAASVARVDALVAQLQSIIKSIAGQIDREINKNRDKLTPDAIFAKMGADKAASLQAAKADLVAFANKWAPGTFLS